MCVDDGGRYLPAPAFFAIASSSAIFCSRIALLQRRKLNLKAKLESSSSHFSFQCLVPGGFNMGSMWSTCNALPSDTRSPPSGYPT